MPSRRTFLAGAGVLAGGGCVGVRADAGRRRDRVAAAVSSSPDAPEPVTVTDDHLASAVAAFESAKERLESEGGRPASHGYGPDDDAPHADAATRWDGVQALRRATWTLERHVGRRRAQGGMDERDVRDRLDQAEASVDHVTVEYTGRDRYACLVQSAVAEDRLAGARQSLERGRDEVDDGGFTGLYGAFASARVAGLYAEDAAALQATLDGHTDQAGWIESVYGNTGDPGGSTGFENLAGVPWWEVTRSTPDGLRELADRRSEAGRLGSAALAGVGARHHAAAQQHFVETVESVPTTLDGVLEARERAVAALEAAAADGALERRLLGDAMEPLRQTDGLLRKRTDHHDQFYRWVGDESDRRELGCHYLVAAALADRVAPVADEVRNTV